MADSTSFTPNSIRALDELADFLRKNSSALVEIGGHTSGLPAHEYCDKLSLLRAENVVKHLISKGVNPNQLSAKGYGKRAPVSDNATESDALLQFKRRNSFTNVVSLCNRTRSILEKIVSSPYEGTFENIFFAGQVHSLLLYGLECLVEDKAAESFSCGFLSQESDREKMLQAKELLHQHIGNPITIKELSRKVGTNECYLKKGFKEMFGTTIFDYYQRKRMEHATFLLNEKGLSVTEVSMLLGYSSISHFSTAFKKHTGIKPCELLLR